jgi:hypothetical protein
MTLAWRKTDDFCPLWTPAKPRPSRSVAAIGTYPTDAPRQWKTSQPVLSKILEAKTRRHETARPVRSTALKPSAVSKPQIELLPSTEARYPRSLTRLNLVQLEGQAWHKPSTSNIWNIITQRILRTHFPAHELRDLKPRVWRRALESPKVAGLQSEGKRTFELVYQRPLSTGRLGELMTPTWRQGTIRDSAITPSILVASLAGTDALTLWSRYDTAPLPLKPLRLLPPDYTVSVPELKPLR